MEKTEFKDAFGADLIIGGIYGSCRLNNGFTHTIIGTLKSVSDEGMATIEVTGKFKALYNNPVTPDKKGRDVSIVKANTLIPTK